MILERAILTCELVLGKRLIQKGPEHAREARGLLPPWFPLIQCHPIICPQNHVLSLGCAGGSEPSRAEYTWSSFGVISFP